MIILGTSEKFIPFGAWHRRGTSKKWTQPQQYHKSTWEDKSRRESFTILSGMVHLWL